MKRTLAAVTVAAALIATSAGVTPAAAATTWWDEGGDLPPTELMDGDAGVRNLKDKAMVRASPYGFVYIAGQQDSRLRIRYNERRDKIVYRDRGTEQVKRKPGKCRERDVDPGIAIICRIPPRFEDGMFVQVWPRLGNDRTNARGMPERFRLWVLADAGDDVVLTGDGDDFVNGARGDDVVDTGSGDDWMRGGKDADTMDAGDGNDKLVGGGADDLLFGGPGDDKLYGGPGDDVLDGGPGTDVLVPNPGERVPDTEP